MTLGKAAVGEFFWIINFYEDVHVCIILKTKKFTSGLG